MRNLSVKEHQTINAINENTARYRKEVIQFKKDDRSFAFFRLQADHHIRQIIIRHAIDHPFGEETQEFLETYLNDPDEEFDEPLRRFLYSLEKATGRPVESVKMESTAP